MELILWHVCHCRHVCRYCCCCVCCVCVCCLHPSLRRAGDLFGQRNILLKARAVLTRGLAGVDNVYTQVCTDRHTHPTTGRGGVRNVGLHKRIADRGACPHQGSAQLLLFAAIEDDRLLISVCACCYVPIRVCMCVQHVPLLSETLRMLATNDLSAAAYPYAAGSQVCASNDAQHRGRNRAFFLHSTAWQHQSSRRVSVLANWQPAESTHTLLVPLYGTVLAGPACGCRSCAALHVHVPHTCTCECISIHALCMLTMFGGWVFVCLCVSVCVLS